MQPATNPNRAPQIVATVVLVARATPALIRHFPARANPSVRAAATSRIPWTATALADYDFCLEESARAAGIDYKHEAPHLDPKLNPINEEIASMGASVTIVDYRPRRPARHLCHQQCRREQELSLPQRGERHLRRRRREDGDRRPEPARHGVCMGAVWGDYDNDGYEDLLVYRWGKPELYHNDAGKGFTDVTAKPASPVGQRQQRHLGRL